MLDCFNRRINYLRISVTDRCNLRCTYCMPPKGIKLVPHEEILSFEQIITVVNEAVLLGINKVRITGGEPLLRRDIVDLVSMLSSISGIDDLAMTTNGILLEKYSSKLYQKGLHRINISLDTLDPDRYKELTRGGDIDSVVRGIKAARESGLSPIKLNCVVDDRTSPRDYQLMKDFAKASEVQVRFIRRMDIAQGAFWQVEGGDGGNCLHCNRLRLTSTGMIRPCLFSDLGYSVKELGAQAALMKAITNKPEKGTVCHNSDFYNIGG